MKLSVTSWSLPQCSLDEAVGLSKLLGINAIDLGYFYRSSLDKNEIINEPEAAAKKIRDYEIKVSFLYHLFGADTQDRNLSLKDAGEENVKQLERVLLFCSEASVDTIFLLPGVINPGQSVKQAMHRSAENLKRMVEVCQKKGITLAIEPHIGSCLESPELAEKLIDMVPGLTLILDYAHFICLGYPQAAIDRLAPHAGHVHLRQAKPGHLQTDLASGIINFQAVLGKLVEHLYEGYLSIEYVHQDYMNTLHEDVLSETIKMRDLVEEWNQNSE
jgi:sugar phosphate isomerase/epimerase